MRTNDTTYANNGPHILQNQNIGIDEDNSDSISQRDEEKSGIIDNYTMCQKYGQSGIEKAIFLLISIILISGLILYYNLKIIKSLFIKLLCIAAIIDLLLLLFYCYLRIKLSSDEWFNSFPIQLDNYMEYAIIINFLLKLATFIVSFFYKKTYGSLILICFKFLLDFYFLMSCVKRLGFCPKFKTFEECIERAIGSIKNLLICCNEHETEGNEYKKIYEESNYDTMWGNEIQFDN